MEHDNNCPLTRGEIVKKLEKERGRHYKEREV